MNYFGNKAIYIYCFSPKECVCPWGPTLFNEFTSSKHLQSCWIFNTDPFLKTLIATTSQKLIGYLFLFIFLKSGLYAASMWASYFESCCLKISFDTSPIDWRATWKQLWQSHMFFISTVCLETAHISILGLLNMWAIQNIFLLEMY